MPEAAVLAKKRATALIQINSLMWELEPDECNAGKQAGRQAARETVVESCSNADAQRGGGKCVAFATHVHVSHVKRAFGLPASQSLQERGRRRE